MKVPTVLLNLKATMHSVCIYVTVTSNCLIKYNPINFHRLYHLWNNHTLISLTYYLLT